MKLLRWCEGPAPVQIRYRSRFGHRPLEACNLGLLASAWRYRLWGECMSGRFAAAGLAVLFLYAGSAQAANTEADWLKPPSPEDLAAVWPVQAWREGLGGRAVISCKVNTHGALFDCAVESETPDGAGFGTAALALTPQLLMKPATRNGVPVVSDVRIPINFKTPDVATGTRIPGGNGPYGGGSRQVLSNVPWVSAPTYAQVAAAYPKRAREQQIGGRVTLSCRFKADGRLGGCASLQEEPKGAGFYGAAKSLADAFLAPTELPDGTKIAGIETHIPFTFGVEMLDPAKRVIGKPRWAALPEGKQVLGGYPPAAVKAGVGNARVVMDCAVADGGRLESCSLQTEDPPGLGFAQSALDLVGAFQLRPWTAEGLPTIGGRVRIPIRYQLPEEPPPAP
jgi:TonB family protein